MANAGPILCPKTDCTARFMPYSNPMSLTDRQDYEQWLEVHACGDPVTIKEQVDNMVHHPPHYTGHPKGIECIDVIEDSHHPNLANAIKYIWRVTFGDKGNPIQDLEKARWYLDREIQRRKK